MGPKRPTRFEDYGVNRGLGVPSFAPEAHGPDLLGLIPPDRLGEGAHTGGANVEDKLAHAQGTGVVLHHRVQPAQVVGGPCWTHVVGMVMDLARLGRWPGGLGGRVVMEMAG